VTRSANKHYRFHLEVKNKKKTDDNNSCGPIATAQKCRHKFSKESPHDLGVEVTGLELVYKKAITKKLI
jgi:hypothetical protein